MSLDSVSKYIRSQVKLVQFKHLNNRRYYATKDNNHRLMVYRAPCLSIGLPMSVHSLMLIRSELDQSLCDMNAIFYYLPNSVGSHGNRHYNDWLRDAIGRLLRDCLKLVNVTLAKPSRNNCKAIGLSECLV